MIWEKLNKCPFDEAPSFTKPPMPSPKFEITGLVLIQGFAVVISNSIH